MILEKFTGLSAYISSFKVWKRVSLETKNDFIGHLFGTPFIWFTDTFCESIRCWKSHLQKVFLLVFFNWCRTLMKIFARAFHTKRYCIIGIWLCSQTILNLCCRSTTEIHGGVLKLVKGLHCQNNGCTLCVDFILRIWYTYVPWKIWIIVLSKA